MYSKVVNVLARATTGDQDITFTPNSGDPSWTPKVAIVQWNRACTATSTWFENQSYGIGFTDGTNQRCVSTGAEDNQTTMDTATVQSNTALVTTLTPTGTVATVDCKATFSTWLSNGMRINWSDAPGAQFYLTVLFLGGTDLTNVSVGTITTPTGTGTFSVSSLGYQPEFGMFLFGNNAVSTTDTPTGHSSISLGAATDSSNQWTQSYYCSNAAATSSNRQYYSHTSILTYHTTSKIGTVAFSSFDSGGFTLNVTDDLAVALPIFYLVMKGGSYAVGNNTEPGSTGNQTVTTSKDTKAVAIFGNDIATADSMLSGCMWSGGVADNGINQFGHVWEDQNAAAVSIIASALDGANHIYNNITAAATVGSTTWDDSAILSSVSSTGFVINWDNIGLARPYRYITWGNAAGTLTSRTISETSVSVSESLSRLPLYTRPISESVVSVSENLARIQFLIKAIAETATTSSESLARVPLFPKSISESAITVNDSPVRLFLPVRAIAATATTTNDSISRFISINYTLAEPSISVSGTAASNLFYQRIISDPALSVADTLSRIQFLIKTITEPSVSVSADSISRILIAIKSISDPAITVNQSITRIPTFVRSISDTPVIAISDSLLRLLSATRSISDPSITVGADSVSRLLVAPRSISDPSITVGVGSISRFLAATRPVQAETVAVGDTLNRIQFLIKSIAEPSITVNDAITRGFVFTVLLVESRIKWYYSLLTRKI